MREQVEICKCDRCAAVLDQPVSFGVHTDYQSGAVSQEKLIEYVDLCNLCASIFIHRVINKYMFDQEIPQAKVFVKIAKDQTPLSRQEKP